MTQELRSRLTLRPGEYHTLSVIEEYVIRHAQQQPWEDVVARSEFDALYNPETETVTFRLKDRRGAQHAGIAVAIDVDDLAVMPEPRVLSMIGPIFLKHLKQGLPHRARGTAYHTEVVTN